MKRTLIKKLICCLFITPLFLFLLTSCTADLGDFSNDSDGYKNYYDSIDDIVGIYEEGSEFKEASYDVKNSITNDYIIDNLSWEKSEYEVASRQYAYIVIPFKRDLKIEELVLFLKTDTDTSAGAIGDLEISAFYFKNSDSRPDKSKLKKIGDADDSTDYSDPLKENRVASATLSVKRTFEDFGLYEFRQTVDIGESYIVDGCLQVKKDSYLYLRIENNSALNRNMTPIDISFINLLVRAI